MPYVLLGAVANEKCVAMALCCFSFVTKYINARHPFLIFYDAEGNKKEEIGCVSHTASC